MTRLISSMPSFLTGHQREAWIAEQAARDEEAARLAAEDRDARKARQQEARREEVQRLAEAAAEARKARAEAIAAPFAFEVMTPPADAPRPTFFVKATGGSLHTLLHARLKAELAADLAEETAAAEAVRETGEDHQRLAQMERLQVETARQLDDAAAELRRHEAAVTAAVLAGLDPSDAEKAVREARGLLTSLEERLPLIEAKLPHARLRASMAEGTAKNAVRERCSQRRQAEQAARDEQAGKLLEAALRVALGVTGG